jgi:peptidyl-dipeptidase A
MAGSPRWAAAIGIMDAKARDRALPEAESYLAFSSLQFSRWALVMLHFERALYRDPNQDLNRLWWDLVEKYQGVKRPPGRNAPDYASKIHLVVAPVYYQNYMLGELFSAQLHEALAKELGRPPAEAVYVGEPKVGELLRSRVFAPGSRYPWGELVERATGRPLGPEAFARRFEPKKG